MPINKTSHNIVLFDGVCNFCNSSVNFVIRKDKKNIFRFAPLQSEKAKELIAKYAINQKITESFVYIEDDRVYIKSTAALKIARHLQGFYPLFYGLIIIPGFVRNYCYDIIARKRYKWWGKKETCMIPSEDVKSKFIF